MGKDYYNLLGVDKDASEDDIKKAYKKMVRHLPCSVLSLSLADIKVPLVQALKWHPDRNAGSEAASKKFQEVTSVFLSHSSLIRANRYLKLSRSSAISKNVPYMTKWVRRDSRAAADSPPVALGLSPAAPSAQVSLVAPHSHSPAAVPAEAVSAVGHLPQRTHKRYSSACLFSSNLQTYAESLAQDNFSARWVVAALLAACLLELGGPQWMT